MAVKKATVDSTMAKVEAAAKAAAPAEKKAPAKKSAPAKKAEVKEEVKAEVKAVAPAEKKAPAKKAAPAKKTETKAAAPAKKAPAKKAVAPATKVVIEYANGQVDTADIVSKAVAASGKASIKNLNVYYQPETNMVYFTADGEEGSFSL